MYCKKFFAAALPALLSLSVLFTACSVKDTPDTKVSGKTVLETTSETEAESSSVTESISVSESTTESTEESVTEAAETSSETEETAETDDPWEIPETGLVYFIQPEIKQYDEYDDWHLADWECRDTEVKRGYHSDGEWNYTKELIFVFSNYTDEPITVDSIQINKDGGEVMKFANGESVLEIDLTVQPMHKTDYLLKAEDFDYSACESGIYNTVANVGLEGYGGTFFINNGELYEETVEAVFDRDRPYTGIAPDFLTEEQQAVFAKACVRMEEFFWCDGCLAESYAKINDADDFIGLFTDVFTEDYVRQLAQGTYFDEDGELIAGGFGRGSDISYFDHCFFPISSDEEQVTFKAVVVHCHGDSPYNVWFDEKNYHMVNTENGWRVDLFEVWN